ncbi:antibiotic biosynthesis monooxygenase [Chitinophaga agrisoli]|uniref:Antibiotic biosynthesis monooxygenase n=1 Tax=Chitinophaga agrisoli TaxID=2607653 RepID=A0A5B2VZ28_9BACT|nr:antibiotic biosynthesis monooxygenase [Chitinophaga agrisoli]KAA2243496.1 antibiotic biosynthesis monooxygenase [Chitinophaga agrisoli]
MVKFGFLVRLEAKPGKEQEAAAFIKNGLFLAQKEPLTVNWYGLQLGPSTFGVFDAFETAEARTAHLHGELAAELMAIAPDLFAKAPSIEEVDILAVK